MEIFLWLVYHAKVSSADNDVGFEIDLTSKLGSSDSETSSFMRVIPVLTRRQGEESLHQSNWKGVFLGLWGVILEL